MDLAADAYSRFFRSVTGLEGPPYPYQAQLATEPWPDLLDVPTGLGKTAAVVVAWLWRRLNGDPATPRRLVYCLPMRVLVEQTHRLSSRWCEVAKPLFADRSLAPPAAHVLMGGDLDETWANLPESPAVLVGTQDMLLSRALNRGYGMSRYRWPIHFGLLNADCLWVLDETQLMGVAVETSAQLQAFREATRLGTFGEARTLWMSATLGRAQLSTVDHPQPPGGWRTHELCAAEGELPAVRKRTTAPKRLRRFEGAVLGRTPDLDYGSRLAAAAIEEVQARGGLTLVLVNTVRRAQEVYRQIEQAIAGTAPLALLHGRFRSPDRMAHEQVLHSIGDRIVVATQVIEAGVDVSGRTLITELAPWPSLVQRFGRINRYGEAAEGHISWVDIDIAEGASGSAAPYEARDLDEARRLLAASAAQGGDASPEALRKLPYAPPEVLRPVLRRRDLLDLFDTTPDLLGNDLDIARFVRDGEDRDVLFYWREFDGERPQPGEPGPGRDELCRASIGAAAGFLQGLERKRQRLAAGGELDRQRGVRLAGWSWNPLTEVWDRVLRPRPGQEILLHAEAGGYSAQLGWLGDGPKPLPVAVDRSRVGAESQEGMNRDLDTGVGRWVSLTDHLAHVAAEARRLCELLPLADRARRAVLEAARWHDVGKAHPQFQAALILPVRDDPAQAPPAEGIWAKSSHRRRTRQARPLRHELASALAWLDGRSGLDADLVAYLIAAHHGKVRLSIRSLPGERPRPPEGKLFARGIWDGDELPEVVLPGDERVGPFRLDLSPMQLGQGSWLQRTLGLRDSAELGPFRLAFLEALLRVADARASAAEKGED